MNGSRGSSPYDAFSTVPTKDERAGNFSGATYNDGQPVQVLVPNVSPAINPTVCQPGGTTNSIAASCISPAATALLNSIPLPNIMPNVPATASGQNFHYVNSAESSSDTVILRLINNFGRPAGRAPVRSDRRRALVAEEEGGVRRTTLTRAELVAKLEQYRDPFPRWR